MLSLIIIIVKMLMNKFLLISILSTTRVYSLRLSVPLSFKKNLKTIAASAFAALICDNSAVAVSGGGKDFAGKEIRSENFDGKSFIAKDFTQCDAAGASFKNSVLKGSRFYRANLKDVDFSGADLSAASLEDTSLQGVIFANARLEGTYFSASVTEAANIQGADFTEAQMPDFALKALCGRTDAKGTNPTTGVDTFESLMCR